MSSYDPFERMREIEIFGVPALFTDKAIPLEAVHPWPGTVARSSPGMRPSSRAANSWVLYLPLSRFSFTLRIRSGKSAPAT